MSNIFYTKFSMKNICWYVYTSKIYLDREKKEKQERKMQIKKIIGYDLVFEEFHVFMKQ